MDLIAPLHVRIKPLFKRERIYSDTELEVAMQRVKARQEHITRYLDIRRELEGYVAVADIYRCAASFVYETPFAVNSHEMQLRRTTREMSKDFVKEYRAKLKRLRLSARALDSN